MKNLTLQEAQKNLRIDKSSLDEDIINQPQLFYNVSEQFTKAKADRDTQKDKLQRIESQRSIFYRKDLEDDKKPTEGQIRENVLNDRQYKAQKEKYLNSVALANKWEDMKEAYMQRSYMLKELVNLWSSNYNGDPTISGGKNLEERVNKANRQRLRQSRVKRDRKEI